MDRRLRLAVFGSLGLHGVLIMQGVYRLSYDAYIHMFFADHYRQTWWELWEPRWYTGFSISSYPPLVHQVIAVVSGLVGVERAWSIVLLGTLTILPLGVYTFSRIFVGRYAAGYAAVLTTILPSVALTAHTFGQLPTLVALTGTLFALAVLANYIRNGHKRDVLLAVSITGVVTSSHHGTLLFYPWGVAAIGIHFLLIKKVRWQVLIRRASVFVLLAAVAAFLVIWPFWQWGLNQTMQKPIDHASRHNFFQDTLARTMFLWPMYGALFFVIPLLLWLALRSRLFAIVCLFLLMFIQGLGGTTSIPRWLYGDQWEWLTYDRFSLWASVTLMPLLGSLITILRRQRHHIWRLGLTVGFILMSLSSLYAAFLASILPTQPARIDMEPIVEFLAEDDRSQWRYLTFGFGDQMAWLSILTKATTIDGSYHTARNLPVLRVSGIGQIDAAYWMPQGLNALDPVLEVSDGYGVRWGFVNLQAYEGASVQVLLIQHGWELLKTLSDNIEVWENSSAILPRLSDSAPTNVVAGLSWGILPLGNLLIALTLVLIRFIKIPHPMLGSS